MKRQRKGGELTTVNWQLDVFWNGLAEQSKHYQDQGMPPLCAVPKHACAFVILTYGEDGDIILQDAEKRGAVSIYTLYIYSTIYLSIIYHSDSINAVLST